MDFDTDDDSRLRSERIAQITQHLRRNVLTGEVSNGPSRHNTRDDEPQLKLLDQMFAPLMEAAKPRPKSGITEPLVLSPAEQYIQDQARQVALDEEAKALFLRECQTASATSPELFATPASANSPQAPKFNQAGRPIPRRGLGPRIVIGFDAEWEAKPNVKGRNDVLCCQLYCIGPTGETHGKVFKFVGGDAIESRPSLAEVLDEFLDEAEREGVFEEFPHEVVLAGFFTRADITIFRDFKQFRKYLSGINGTLASVGEIIPLMLPMDDERAERMKSRYRYVLGVDFNPCELKVRVIDASRLAPPGTSLQKIGAWLNEPKVELPPQYDKAHMREVMIKDPELFERYALQDARIPALYVLWVLWFCNRHLGLKGLSATVSGLSVRLAELCMRKDGVHPDVALNFDSRTRIRWDNYYNRPVTSRERVPTDIRRWLQPFIADTFQGGRNEAFVFGPTALGMYYDLDLSGAYVAGLAEAMTLDYDKAFMTTQVGDFLVGLTGFAKVKFKFPDNGEYPCLPVKAGLHGLWYPMEGISLCGAPEIELAASRHAHIEIIFGLIIPFKPREQVFDESASRIENWQKSQAKSAEKAQKRQAAQERWEAHAVKSAGKHKKSKPPSSLPVLEETAPDVLMPPAEMQFPPDPHNDRGYRMFESFAAYVRHKREQFARKTLPFEFTKLIGNGLYGKTGQGLKDKRVFDPKDMRNRPVGPSQVTEAAVASLVCSFIRAVASEILVNLPPGAAPIYMATDGLMSDVPMDKLDLSGPLCRRFQALVNRIAPGTSMVELKHGGKQVVVPRTRGLFTSAAAEGYKVMTAKAGHKVVLGSDQEHNRWLLSDEGSSDFMIRLMLDRRPGQTLPRESFFSTSEQLLNDYDLQTDAKNIRVSLEFDFKRRPVNPRMVRVENYGTEHLAFDTVPWQTIEDGLLTRTLFDHWRQKNCLKTMADWVAWEAFRIHYSGNRLRRLKRAKAPDAEIPATSPASISLPRPGGATTRGKTGRMHVRDGNYLRVAIRTFLAAYVQRDWGLDDVTMSQSELAKWLSEQGYACSLSDVKNSGRSQLNEFVVAAIPPVVEFLAVVARKFPRLQTHRFIAVF